MRNYRGETGLGSCIICRVRRSRGSARNLHERLTALSLFIKHQQSTRLQGPLSQAVGIFHNETFHHLQDFDSLSVHTLQVNGGAFIPVVSAPANRVPEQVGVSLVLGRAWIL